MNHVCEHCFPHAVELGLVAPGLSLILNEGRYSLLWGYGHIGDVLVTFTKPPWPDPDPECKDGLTGEEDALAIEWLDDADEVLGSQLSMHATSGYWLVMTCKEAGYGSTGHKLLNYWLYHQCGLLVKERGNG